MPSLIERLAEFAGLPFEPPPPESSPLRVTAFEEIERGLARLREMEGIAAEPFTAEEVGAMSRAEVLQAAMEQGAKVEVTYTRKHDGATGVYRGDAIEIGPHYPTGQPVLWMQVDEGTGAAPLADTHTPPGIHTRGIHALLLDRIDDIRALGLPATPDWPVVPESVRPF